MTGHPRAHDTVTSSDPPHLATAPNPHTNRAWIALAFFAAVLYLLGLGSPFAPTNGDEMVYIHIARLTAESGNWLPLVSDLANMRNTKPPLLIWQALVAGNWGEQWNLFVLRLPSVAYTFLTAAGVAVLTHRLHRHYSAPHAKQSKGSVRAACIAAILYLTFFSTFRFGRVYLTSAPETFWLALPMFWLLWHAGKPAQPISIRTYVWFGVAFGLGCAYKSFALVAPAAATVWLCTLWTQPRWEWQTVFKISARLTLSTAIALGIFGLWFVLDPDPAAVWNEFVMGENAGKMGGGAGGGAGGGYWHDALQGSGSIWVQLLAYFENAGLLWFVAMGLAWALFRHGAVATTHHMPTSSQRKDGSPHFKILLLWLVVWLVVFTIPTQRSARYVIPAMPALAILAALAWDRIHRAWFWLTLLLTVPALVMLARIGWVLNATDIGAMPLLIAVLLAGATGLAAVIAGVLKPTATRAATLVASLSVYACFIAMTAPLSRDAANYSVAVQQQLSHKTVAVPNGFNAQYERFHFLLPQSTLAPYDTEGRNTGALYPELPGTERLVRLLQEFDAVVWVQPSLTDVQPSCAPQCTVVAQRWHVKSRHQSGEVTLKNVWFPQEWLFRREWLVVNATKTSS